eukprot:TRINITY_DN1203_c0_g1_i11.p3 TRINITY_DN1203_c0_g1~~TRINITY_DN1203_c0_g1_i11.p3  ORF type:complete len:144 (+),score=36.09 TRINITY_DN1203_c0_g1_i11:825-1256(+)
MLPTRLPPVPTIGVSLRFLRDFVARHRRHLDGLSTAQVCERIVKPATAAARCAYAELAEVRAVAGLVGPASVFVSHVWAGEFGRLVAVLEEWWAGGGEERECYLWVDVFVNNQHGTEERPYEWWTGVFADSIRRIGLLCVVVC